MLNHNDISEHDWADKFVELIDKSSHRDTRIMLASGTQTAAALKNGIYDLLPASITLIAGPGCAESAPTTCEIDKAVALCREKKAIITTPENLLRVPGSSSSLELQKAKGADVRTVQSAREAQKIAASNPESKVVFVGAGFEAAASGTAAAVIDARRQGTKNFFILSLHRMIVPALEAVVSNDEAEIDGILCPGHISAVIGSNAYLSISKEYKVPCVISGFSTLDMLHSIYMLLKQLEEGRAGVQTQFKSAITLGGNRNAVSAIERVFRPTDTTWRGLGRIPKSGLMIRLEYRAFKAESAFDLSIKQSKERKDCVCGDIIAGKSNPLSCALFGGDCTPENPAGPAMASSEGPCSVFHFCRETETSKSARPAA